jgi:hypothetical protein
VSALVYAGLVAGWQLVVVPRLPPAIFHGEGDDGPLVWIEPHGMFLSHGDVHAADLLFVGDSRMSDGIDFDALDAAGVDDAAMLWAASARLVDLLPAVRELPARRLVVGFSILSLERPRAGAATEVVRGSAPPASPEDLDRRLAQWGDEQVAQLVTKGFDQDEAQLVVDRMAELQRAHVLRQGWSPRAIDRRLDDWADAVRDACVRTVSTELWRESWFYEIDPAKSNPVYVARVRQELPRDRQDTLERVGELLTGLVDDGWVVVCVRLPVSDELRAIEELALPSSAFSDLCAALGVRYLDYSAAPYSTRDGSHLLAPDAARFTERLVDELGPLARP